MSTKPVLLLCGCKAYEPYLLAAMRRFAHDSWELVGVIGDPTLTAPVFDESTRLLTLPVSDTYEALPTKIHAAFAWIHTQWPNTIGVFKTDDDILLNLDDLVNAVRTFAPTPFWGFQVSHCMANYVSQQRINVRFADKKLRPKHQSAFYCFGHGYWLSASALRIVVPAGEEYAKSYLEDVCTGYVLNQAGLVPARIPITYREVPRSPELLRLSQ